MYKRFSTRLVFSGLSAIPAPGTDEIAGTMKGATKGERTAQRKVNALADRMDVRR